jgi:hypothetical protein
MAPASCSVVEEPRSVQCPGDSQHSSLAQFEEMQGNLSIGKVTVGVLAMSHTEKSGCRG